MTVLYGRDVSIKQGLLLAGLVCALVSTAHADDKAAAESAFLRGRELLKAGKVAEACDSFARSEKLDPQMGTRYNLALCYEQEGRLASAWGLFRELAQRDTNSARKKDSTTRAAAIAPGVALSRPYSSRTAGHTMLSMSWAAAIATGGRKATSTRRGFGTGPSHRCDVPDMAVGTILALVSAASRLAP